MRITVEQHLPCSLGELRIFLDKATHVVNQDMTARVNAKTSGYLSITAVTEDDETEPDL